MEKGLYSPLGHPSSIELTVRFQSLKDYFKNHRHQVFIKRNVAELVRKALATDEGAKVDSMLVKAAETLASFKSSTTAHQLFVDEKKDIINQLSAKKRQADASLNPLAAYQSAVKDLWAQADQDAYKARVSNGGTTDIFA